MQNKTRTGINAGSTSILAIFVLLCLTTFATLSMVSANADYNLSKKAADSAALYYRADAQAEELLLEVDRCMESAAPLAQNREEYFDLCAAHLELAGDYQMDRSGENLIIRYRVPMGDTQALQVAVEAVYPHVGEQRFRRLAWQVVSTQEWDLGGDGLELWDGGDLGGALAFFDGSELQG